MKDKEYVNYYACPIGAGGPVLSLGRVVIVASNEVTRPPVYADTVYELDPMATDDDSDGEPGFRTADGCRFLFKNFMANPQIETMSDGTVTITLPDHAWCFPPRV